MKGSGDFISNITFRVGDESRSTLKLQVARADLTLKGFRPQNSLGFKIAQIICKYKIMHLLLVVKMSLFNYLLSNFHNPLSTNFQSLCYYLKYDQSNYS